jgi:hypothetical protein
VLPAAKAGPAISAVASSAAVKVFNMVFSLLSLLGGNADHGAMFTPPALNAP